jgi:hypothetical protein
VPGYRSCFDARANGSVFHFKICGLNDEGAFAPSFKIDMSLKR